MTTQLYDRDFFEWTQCNAALLRAGRFDQADIEHIAEEIHDMGVSQKRELRSRVEVLLVHLLKWQGQPALRGSSWNNTIEDQRDEIAKLVHEMPSLRPGLAAQLSDVYRYAVRKASREAPLLKGTLPASCPFTLDQILDEEFFPE